jgi:hypothetical protein
MQFCGPRDWAENSGFSFPTPLAWYDRDRRISVLSDAAEGFILPNDSRFPGR